MRWDCKTTCEHLRSFRYGFDGATKILAPFDKRERMATCALKTDVVLHMRACPVCWRETNHD
jgi:hypothetical protein